MMNILFMIFLLFFIPCTDATTINLVPISGNENAGSYFNRHARDNCMNALCDLRDALDILGHELKIVSIEQACKENIKTIVFDTIPPYISENHDREKWNLFLWEPPTVLSHTYQKNLHGAFNKVFTLFDQFVDGDKYHKFHYPQPILSMVDDVVPFAKKKIVYSYCLQ